MKLKKTDNKIRSLWNVTYIIAAILSATIFVIEVFNRFNISNWIPAYLIIIFITAISVHMMKALRLYIILFGNQFSLSCYIQRYIKTATLNLLLPFKTGEIYRGYCIGEMIGSYADGYIIVIFDRFVDTLALISIVLISTIIADFEISAVYAILTLFLIVIILIYILFLPLKDYWNNFLIFKKSSKNTLKGLHIIKTAENAYKNINDVVKGRFIILCFLSLVAWGLEIGSLFLVGQELEKTSLGIYLTDILKGTLNSNNIVYTICCFIFFVIVETGLVIVSKRRNKNETNSCI
jgi:uncharacterized protein (TIRG00374 family)